MIHVVMGKKEMFDIANRRDPLLVETAFPAVEEKRMLGLPGLNGGKNGIVSPGSSEDFFANQHKVTKQPAGRD
jgi:hypothetical protein